MVDTLLTWGLSTGAMLIVVVIGHWLLFRVLTRVTGRTPLLARLFHRCTMPTRVIVLLIASYVATFNAPVENDLQELVRHALSLLLIGAWAWLANRAGYVLMDAAMQRHVIETSDNLHARRVRTQILVLRRVMTVGIALFALAAMLTTFSEVRALGASLLASAGIIGVVAGVAAQPTLGNLIAGIQIAFTEPIRIDDVVVVEEEWGRIEEITLTYVVVRIWDQRRLVLPISYFVQTPFQNWTRNAADILGSVYLYTDYTVPVDAIRREFERILDNSDLWDRKARVLQVTNATENSVELRALMSAPDSSSAWDLRCHVREELIGFVQRQHPEALPRTRAEIGVSEDGPEGVVREPMNALKSR